LKETGRNFERIAKNLNEPACGNWKKYMNENDSGTGKGSVIAKNFVPGSAVEVPKPRKTEGLMYQNTELPVQ